MQNVNWARHAYFDVSDLNAKWDQARPAVAGLGAVSNGSLSGNALGIVGGLGADPSYPWREYSADTLALQQETNRALRANGFLPVTEDGYLGPGTCGAVREMCSRVSPPCEPPSTCQSFEEPKRGGASMPTAPREPTELRTTGGRNWVIIGAGVGLVAIGAALILKRKR